MSSSSSQRTVLRPSVCATRTPVAIRNDRSLSGPMSSNRSAARRNVSWVASSAASADKPRRRSARHTAAWWALKIRSRRTRSTSSGWYSLGGRCHRRLPDTYKCSLPGEFDHGKRKRRRQSSGNSESEDEQEVAVAMTACGARAPSVRRRSDLACRRRVRSRLPVPPPETPAASVDPPPVPALPAVAPHRCRRCPSRSRKRRLGPLFRRRRPGRRARAARR